MKKILNLLLCLILVIVLTACTNDLKQKTPLDVLNDVMHNTKEVKNIELTLGLDTKFVQDGALVEMPLSLSFEQNFVNTKNYKAVIKISDNPFIKAQTLYVDVNETTSKVYIPGKLIASIFGVQDDSDKWIGEKIEISEEDFNVEDLTEKYENIDIKKILKEDEFVLINEGTVVNKYQLKITKDLLVRIEEMLNIENKGNFNEFNQTIFINLYIDVKNSRITKMEIDLKDIVSKVLEDNLSDDASISSSSIKKLDMYLEIKYDTPKIEIPGNVYKNEVTKEEYTDDLTGKVEG